MARVGVGVDSVINTHMLIVSNEHHLDKRNNGLSKGQAGKLAR